MKGIDDRTPPTKIRVTRLQEAQLPELVKVDHACNAMYFALGFDPAEVPARSATDFVALLREHDVRVAEADHVPAAVLIWRDESPGVAYVADISVHPDYQRFGIGSELLKVARGDARAVGLEQMVVRCWERAAWAAAFYRHHGFVRIDSAAPPKVQAWRDERSEGRPLTRPGEIALWAAVGAAPAADDDGDEPDSEPTAA